MPKQCPSSKPAFYSERTKEPLRLRSENHVIADKMRAMEDFVAYPSRWRIALLALLAAGFAAAGLWMGGALGPPPESRRHPSAVVFAVGWFSAIFFGLCGVIALKRLFDTGEQLRIGATGVRWAPWSDQTIPWAEITDVTTWSVKGQKGLVLHLRDPARFPGRRSVAMFASANRRLTGGDISISPTGTDRSFDDAVAAAAQFRP